jgi:maltooligosyltrehalose trehalohydrolase
VPLNRFIVCLQNHDQVGNRALGDRMHATVASERWRAASVLLLTAPMTPLVFMGQEWAASTPFTYFTDHEPQLGRRVTEGRREEFASFKEFSDPGATARIPDPQAAATFEGSRLRWNEIELPEHARALALYRQLLVLRREHPALSASDLRDGEAVAPDGGSIVMRRSDRGETFWIVARLDSGGEIDLTDAASALGHTLEAGLALVLDTEHAEFTADPQAIELAGPVVSFRRAGAIILKA